ncbi:ribosomal protein S18 acetylase RimI-like enzyme [Isoptericola jiangsuensis]|uniref:Ribosomal protein S18 acetylase RimI-like enzyme n=1 Tax=Isoptericola jiangsuensis TaxID=548579 RepID=A0A2A9EZX4_9MICO|nr:GNAT family N-acetyltransferase [Isoptericola jiangsuensis]PFG43862.1 ribosomal protein S18 acetylase RimI-like enzyme [Isoptericola jiangsuensis]
MTRAVRRLTPADLPAVVDLMADDGGYAERVSGHRAGRDEAVGVLTASPPGVDASAKCVLGSFDGHVLTGVVDVIRDWPDPGVAHIGLLLTADSRQRQGLGRALHDAVVEQVRGWDEATTLRLGIVDANREHAEPFWRALGYRPTGETRAYASGEVRSVTRIWTCPLPRPGAYCSG